MVAIKTTDLTKRYGDITALDGFDLTVDRGEVFGFLGPNGAGKSTTIDMLLDFIRPTDGSIIVSNHNPQRNPRAVREEIGILPDEYSLYDRLTGREHVELAIEMNDSDDDSEAILARVDLVDVGDQAVGSYSKGMVQRLALGMALVGDPSVLILDEPSSGIDPNGVEQMRAIIQGEADRGTTVFFSSHVLEQVEAICDRVAIIDDGELVAIDTIDGLRDSFDTESTLLLTVDAEPTDHGIADLDGVTNIEYENNTLRVDCADPTVKSSVIARVEAAGAAVVDIESEEPSLEALFSQLTTGGESA